MSEQPRTRRADLSQHFLRSESLAASLVQQTWLSSHDLVVEIGPGRGALTHALARRCGAVVAVEVDPALCRGLRERFEDAPNVRVVQRDFLRFPLPADRYSILGNIPYARTAEIVRRLTGAPRPPVDAYLVMQREAAHKFAGGPHAPESLASLLLKPWWQVEILRHLRRADFDPPPRVDSSFLWLARRPRPLVAEPLAGAYRDFVRASFGRRGRTIDACLRTAFTRRQIRRLAGDLRFRLSTPPSGLSFDQWLALFRFRELLG